MRLRTKRRLYGCRHETDRGGDGNDVDIDGFEGRVDGRCRHYSGLNCYGKSGGDAGNLRRREAGHYYCLVGLGYGCC